MTKEQIAKKYDCDKLTILQDNIINEQTKTQTQVQDNPKLKSKKLEQEILDYYKIGASPQEVFLLTDISVDQQEKIAQQKYHMSALDLAFEMQKLVHLEAKHILMENAKSGKQASVELFSKTFGALIENKDQQLIDIRKSELEQKQQGDIITTGLIGQVLENLLQTDTAPERSVDDYIDITTDDDKTDL